MLPIDSMSLKILRYLSKKRKDLIINRRYADEDNEYPDEFYLTSINDLKKLLTFYSKSSVISGLRYLLKNGYIEQNYGENSDLETLLRKPDEKVLEITNIGLSSLRSIYFLIIGLISLLFIFLCLFIILIIIISF